MSSGPAPPSYPEFPGDHGRAGAVSPRDVVLSNDMTAGSELIAPVLAGSRVVGTIDLESGRVGAFCGATLARRLACAAAPLSAAT